MPPRDTHTPVRQIRMTDEMWAALGEATGPRGRSELINRLVARWLGYPGVRVPKRPQREREVET